MLGHDSQWSRWVRKSVFSVVIAFLMGATLSQLLQVPGTPYNLRDLFWQGGNPLNWLMFGLAVLWIGIGSGMTAVALCRLPLALAFAGLPIFAFAVSGISFIFLSLSVTPESVNDLIGTRILIREDVVATQDWNWAPLAQMANKYPAILDWIEGVVRYSGLYAPIPITLSYAVILIGDFLAYNQKAGRRLVMLAAAIPTLWLCRFIVVDLASTTNIIELVATPGPLGINGIVWFYVALSCLAIASSLLWAAAIRLTSWPITLTIFLLLIPLGAFSFRQGLQPSLIKYGHTFSAEQFLIFGDRAGTTIPIVATVILSIGAMVFCLIAAFGLRIVIDHWTTPRRP